MVRIAAAQIANVRIASPKIVETDSKRLKQITINLIQNAVKFTDRGGVTVHVSPAGSDHVGQPGYEIRIEDTGIGMSPERLEQVFRPLGDSFYSIAGERGGAGLGLTISRHLGAMSLLHRGILSGSTPDGFSHNCWIKISRGGHVHAPARRPTYGSSDHRCRSSPCDIDRSICQSRAD